MAIPLPLRDEAAGLATLLAVGLVAAVLGRVVPLVDGAWVFVALVALVLAWPRYAGGPTTADGGVLDDPSEADARTVDAAVGDAVVHDAPDDEGVEEVGPLDIELVNWANGLVGRACPRCEKPISYANLRGTDVRSDHRLACGCTVIEAASLE